MSRLIDADTLTADILALSDCPNGYSNTFDKACIIGIIEEQPTVEAYVWILCRERLPEADGRYLVTRGLNACGALWNRTYILNYSDLMGLKSEKIWWSGNPGKNDFEKYTDVLAWMKLPKAYGKD